MKGKAHPSPFAAFSDSKKRYQFNAGLTGRVYCRELAQARIRTHDFLYYNQELSVSKKHIYIMTAFIKVNPDS